MPFAQKHIGFEDPPKLFLKQDQENANNPLGKTAFYDPGEKSVTLYITGRHPKDILRSLGHELVHHKQNCCGEFEGAGEMGAGYAQNNPLLRTKEEEANRDGSMCLRDFEDMLKKENTIYYEHLSKGENKMSTKDWKNKEVSQLLSEAWGFKFNSLQEFEEFDGNGELQAEGEEEDQRAARKQRKGREDHQRKIREDDDESLEEGEEEIEEGGRDYGRQTPHKSKKYKDEKPAAEDESLEEGDDDDIEESARGRQRGPKADPARDDNRTRPMEEGDDEVVEEQDDDGEVVEEQDDDESADPLQEAIARILRKHLKG